MCGIVGVVVARGHRPGVTVENLCRARDCLAHRGPDGAGVWDGGHVVLAHRRLAVLDPTDAGAQPMGDARGTLAYNGEVYNDAALRDELARGGRVFRSGADSETVLAALGAWGEHALDRFRGMYALAYAEASTGRVLLARDPLGIKPLYWTAWRLGGVAHVAFASEVGALLALPGVACRPDWVTASAYLTTIRTTLGTRTLYEGIRTLEPGGRVWLEPAGDVVRVRHLQRGGVARVPGGAGGDDAVQRVREAIVGSVRAHLRSDVPTCALLSGGLDSTIIAAVARESCPNLRTYCAGAAGGDDLVFARRASEALGTNHAEALIDREMFREIWAWMVGRLGVPLSTPNEVAIYQVASRLRRDGCVVTLSGEGADEIFGGYEAPLRAAAAFERGAWSGASGERPTHPGEFQLLDAAWIPPGAKAAVLVERVWRGIEHDAELSAWYRGAFEECAVGAGDGLAAHLRFLRRVNLAGLLARLDTATMLAGVEGRTPFADAEVAALSDALPTALKFDESIAGVAGTKIVLRRAFAGGVPREVLERPKASFPLPFQPWVEDHAGALQDSPLAREMFSEAARATVAARAAELWRLAWPMVNLALWGRRF